MPIFESIVILFASLSVIRMLMFIEEQNILNKNALTKIGTVAVLFIFIAVKNLPESLVMTVVTAFSPIVLLAISPKFLKTIRERYFERDFKNSLQQILLSMRSGRSFRSSLTQCVQLETNIHHKKIMAQVADFVVFTQHKSNQFRAKTLRKVVFELKKADSDPHLSVLRLENLEKWLKIRSEFRRRSGKVLAQIRIQAVVTLTLYFAVSIFMAMAYEFETFRHLFFISLLLMIVGTTCLFTSGRRLRWRL